MVLNDALKQFHKLSNKIYYPDCLPSTVNNILIWASTFQKSGSNKFDLKNSNENHKSKSLQHTSIACKIQDTRQIYFTGDTFISKEYKNIICIILGPSDFYAFVFALQVPLKGYIITLSYQTEGNQSSRRSFFHYLPSLESISSLHHFLRFYGE